MQQQTLDVVKTGADIASGLTIIGVLAGLIPWLAALAAGFVAVLRAYEMVTGNPAKTLFQRWRKRGDQKSE